jgi:Icc-related predicted phosphoesterase
MSICFFVSDLHGQIRRYEKLFAAIRQERPLALFMGGDLLPSVFEYGFAKGAQETNFVDDYLLPEFKRLKKILGSEYPHIFVILGNDDPRIFEASLQQGQAEKMWEYIHNRQASLNGLPVCGYACVPPTPFMLKDWERYDVSRFVDVGCIAPEQGYWTIPIPEAEILRRTILDDLQILADACDVAQAIFLFHAPPYQTNLDRAALDGRRIDQVPVDVHVGSIAIKRFIEIYQPRLTLHGHIHEAPRLTQAWKEQIGRTVMLSAAHDGPELALVQFNLDAPGQAVRRLL